jgi:hypothetical protein
VGYSGDWRSSVDRPDLFETSAKVCCKGSKPRRLKPVIASFPEKEVQCCNLITGIWYTSVQNCPSLYVYIQGIQSTEYSGIQRGLYLFQTAI